MNNVIVVEDSVEQSDQQHIFLDADDRDRKSGPNKGPLCPAAFSPSRTAQYMHNCITFFKYGNVIDKIREKRNVKCY